MESPPRRGVKGSKPKLLEECLLCFGAVGSHQGRGMWVSSGLFPRGHLGAGWGRAGGEAEVETKKAARVSDVRERGLNH